MTPTYHDHPDWLAHLRGICTHPDADLPRLVAADWLDDFATPESAARAEFVRRQVAAADIACRACDSTDGGACMNLSCPRAETLDGAAWLQYTNDRSWEMCSWPGLKVTYRRGFPYGIRLPLATFLAHAADLFAAAPFTEVEVTDREPYQVASGGRWRWELQFAGSMGNMSRLPADLFARLPVFKNRTSHTAAVKTYYTPDDARQALSRACVTHARHARRAAAARLISPTRFPPPAALRYYSRHRISFTNPPRLCWPATTTTPNDPTHTPPGDTWTTALTSASTCLA